MQVIAFSAFISAYITATDTKTKSAKEPHKASNPSIKLYEFIMPITQQYVKMQEKILPNTVVFKGIPKIDWNL